MNYLQQVVTHNVVKSGFTFPDRQNTPSNILQSADGIMIALDMYFELAGSMYCPRFRNTHLFAALVPTPKTSKDEHSIPKSNAAESLAYAFREFWVPRCE